ncbi:MAG: hypothetical protein WAQ24_04820 [Candidatus Saccharimonadales bacterium]
MTNEVLTTPEVLPLPGEIFEHCMGGRYRVDRLGWSATGYEQTGEIKRAVYYTQLTAGEKFPAGAQWDRSLEEFMHGTVEVDGEVVRIFCSTGEFEEQ